MISDTVGTLLDMKRAGGVWVLTLFALLSCGAEETMQTLSVNSMVRVVFTGDSQSCGRNLAIDFPQLMSRLAPVRVINTAVGGSNSDALLEPMKGKRVRIEKGERVLYGEKVRWGMGPFPGMRVTVNGHRYTIDYIDEHPEATAELHLREPAEESYEGPEFSVEPGWDVRVAKQNPDVVCLMYINDGAMPPAKQANWREMIRRIRALGAVPVLMSPVPIDDARHGGDHPGDNSTYAEGARVARELAREEEVWFIDVFNLTLALDPPLRTVVRDGIHPDTDGSTVIVDGLRWVFERMGLMTARPFVKGWALTGEAAALPVLPAGNCRPFRISQPDHPDPDRQDTKGFSLAARRRNDEYGLIAEEDGHALAVGKGLLLHWGMPRGTERTSPTLRLKGKGLNRSAIGVWNADSAAWQPIPMTTHNGWLTGVVPAEAVREDAFHCLIGPSPQAELDVCELRCRVPGGVRPWRTVSAPPAEYLLASDHADPANLVPNPAFLLGPPGEADGWTLRGGAFVNRPFVLPIARVSLGEEGDPRLAVIEPADRIRPYDLLTVSGSEAGNDGAYRVRNAAGEGRFYLRRRAPIAEQGLRGELRHDDGCGLVAGGCCLELPPGAEASVTSALPSPGGRLELSLFFRAFDPERLGTRDRPAGLAGISLAFLDAGKALRPKPVAAEVPRSSYQWRKLSFTVPVPPDADAVELKLAGHGPEVFQYTGICLRPSVPERRQ